MRSHSFQPLLALSALLTQQVVADEGRGHDAHDEYDAEIVTVWVESTVTTCPTPVAPPPLCPHVPVETITSTISSIVTVTSSTSKEPTPPTSKHTGPASSKPTSSATSKPTGPATSKTVPTVAPTSPTSKSIYWPWPTWMPTTKPTTVYTSTGSLTKSTTKPTVETSIATLTKSTTTAKPDTTTTKPSVHTSVATLTKSTTTSEPDSTTTKTTTETKTTTSSKADTTSKTTTRSTSEKPTTTSTTSTTSKTSTVPATTSKTPTTTSTPSTTATKPSTTTSKTTTSTTTSASPTVKPDACSQYWLDAIKHQGLAPYAVGGSDSYKVYRNVKDYGAKGDGVTDDSAAINRAISDGQRCGQGCAGSTTEPALIYFPPGTYIVSKVLTLYYYTMLIGHPTCLPVIKASKRFEIQTTDPNADEVLFKTNPYGASGPWWGPTNVFWRQVANFEFDTTEVAPTRKFIAIQWPSSQATSLSNIVFKLSAASNTRHIGLQITEGSGGYIGDLVLTGGDKALAVGNQQFTFRNVTISNAKTAVHQVWSWGWLYQGITIRNCSVGFDISNVDTTLNELLVGSVTIIDSDISNTPVGLLLGDNINPTNKVAGNSVILENLSLTNVPVAVRRGSSTILDGSTGYKDVAAWGRGNTYIGKASKKPTLVEGAISPNKRPSSLLSGTHFYTRSKPQYAQERLSSFVSARSAGVKGNGADDDTKALNDLFASAAAAGKIVFLDAGYYLVTGTVRIPAGARITAEAYPIILSSGAYFADASNPKPVVQIGQPGETGSIEWSNTVVSTKGVQPGAILIEYNLDSSAQPSGLWDVHVRIGGFAGSELQRSQCPWEEQLGTVTAETLNQKCVSGFLSVHITKGSSGLLMENCWVWVADHDLERDAKAQRITIYAGRGMLIESTKGNIWMWGGAVEHHQLYEYQFVGAGPTVLGHIQTETAYYQPNPDANIPFAAVSKYHDPEYASGESGIGVRVVNSKDILIYGAGLYSFFRNYKEECNKRGAGSVCQKRVLSIDNSEVSVYNLNGVGVTSLVTVDNVDVAAAADGFNGFPQTVALFRTSGKLLV